LEKSAAMVLRGKSKLQDDVYIRIPLRKNYMYVNIQIPSYVYSNVYIYIEEMSGNIQIVLTCEEGTFIRKVSYLSPFFPCPTLSDFLFLAVLGTELRAFSILPLEPRPALFCS
jgi:hypothetical protein